MSTAKLYAKCLTALEINAALHADAQRFSAAPLHWKLIEATDSHHGLSHTTVPVSLPNLAIILHVETGLIAHKSPAVLDAVDPWSLLTAANWGARDVIRCSRTCRTARPTRPSTTPCFCRSSTRNFSTPQTSCMFTFR